ncbi:MAG: pyrroline-5-carboxylate reductase [Verrucomicrobiaceae bacterium]
MKVALIGCGKMGQALASGSVNSGALKPDQLFLYDPVSAAIDALLETIPDAHRCATLEEAITQADTLLICVKPGDVSAVMEWVSQSGKSAPDLLAISIAAGVPIAAMTEACRGKARIVRVMPNTPCLVGEGAAAFSLGDNATEDDSALIKSLLGSVGLVIQVKEPLLDAVTGLSGSGPAYVFTMIEALADGGLLEGLPRDQALALATQTVLGAAKLVSETGLLPAELRDRVTSPGGTTIAGLAALERGNFRSSVISAVSTATERSRELGR